MLKLVELWKRTPRSYGDAAGDGRHSHHSSRYQRVGRLLGMVSACLTKLFGLDTTYL